MTVTVVGETVVGSGDGGVGSGFGLGLVTGGKLDVVVIKLQ